MGIHWGTLAYICWGIQFKCVRGGGAGEGDKVVGMQLHVYICACVCGRDMQILYL